MVNILEAFDKFLKLSRRMMYSIFKNDFFFKGVKPPLGSVIIV